MAKVVTGITDGVNEKCYRPKQENGKGQVQEVEGVWLYL
jgi:hypothetical protein